MGILGNASTVSPSTTSMVAGSASVSPPLLLKVTVCLVGGTASVAGNTAMIMPESIALFTGSAPATVKKSAITPSSV